jgi:D-3-phosphoglycerate dehydrogenase / 2-oxoglutarate reductase
MHAHRGSFVPWAAVRVHVPPVMQPANPMDVLIVEPIDPDVVQWLSSRHVVRYAPDLAHDPRAFRQALFNLRALIVPPPLLLDAQTLLYAPMLQAVGFVSPGAEHVDMAAFARSGIEVVRSSTASAVAEAEFMIGALIDMLRRGRAGGIEAAVIGRELAGATVGLIGMMPAARTLAQLLKGFGSRVVGYDPAVHFSDGLWTRWEIEPVPLPELMSLSDALCVQMAYFSRYRGLLGERFLPLCKPEQVVVSVTASGVFDEDALAEVLGSGRMAAIWFDHVEPGMLDPGRPLHGVQTLQVTPQVASITRQSLIRSAWAVARRIDELLQPQAPGAFRPMSEDDSSDPEDGEASA